MRYHRPEAGICSDVVRSETGRKGSRSSLDAHHIQHWRYAKEVEGGRGGRRSTKEIPEAEAVAGLWTIAVAWRREEREDPGSDAIRELRPWKRGLWLGDNACNFHRRKHGGAEER